FENVIPAIAERYVGIPFKLGNNLETSGGLDNSHLFCLIYDTATKQAGLRSIGYMPMKDLLKRTVEIHPRELKNGDLIVLNDSHAAMIYRIDNQDKFYMIYASGKRKQVISFNNQNVVFEVYWLENLKGFYRLNKDIFLPQD
ncbi:MAG: peptidoglycan endopeptidase, partial [Deltaproteobacteria bacterium]|nr:peptidoglycan endopeptidase [Deltaproteobacteria bacterium]